MKTPEEIKRGMECCINLTELDDSCSPCPYCGEKLACADKDIDALAYIRQLEREKEALSNIVKKSDYACLYCKHFCYVCTRPSKEIRLNGDCFEWRRVEEEEHD